jgi:hypothetical protein
MGHINSEPLALFLIASFYGIIKVKFQITVEI